MAEPLPRLFVDPASCQAGRVTLTGADAERAYRRGARAGETITVLDNSGWELSVRLDAAAPHACRGSIVGRRLAPEPRTKISLFQGLLHPSDFRRLVTGATARGVVAFVPVIADASLIPAGGLADAEAEATEWRLVARDAAETGGRGRCPTVATPLLFDHALDLALRGGSTVMLDAAGDDLTRHVERRPFSIEAFLPPPGGFTPAERERARARGAAVIAPPPLGPDPVAPTLWLVDALYRLLEGDDGG